MQSLTWLVAACGMLQGPSTAPCAPAPSVAWPVAPAIGPVLSPAFLTPEPPAVGAPPPPAIEYSEFYSTRATIHRYASFATVPLFAAEYAIGRSLYNQTDPSESLRSTHGAVAGAVAGLFALNTVTGAWNLWDSRKDHAGRVRRYIHSALMTIADAGFVWTGALAPDDDEGGAGTNTSGRSRHRTVAISSMSVALAGYLLMMVWKE